jgi:hypothetical protein
MCAPPDPVRRTAREMDDEGSLRSRGTARRPWLAGQDFWRPLGRLERREWGGAPGWGEASRRGEREHLIEARTVLAKPDQRPLGGGATGGNERRVPNQRIGGPLGHTHLGRPGRRAAGRDHEPDGQRRGKSPET